MSGYGVVHGLQHLVQFSGPHYIKRFAHYQAQNTTVLKFFVVDKEMEMRIMGVALSFTVNFNP